MSINGTYKTTTAKMDIKAKELALSIWKARHIWLYVILVPAMPICYITMRKFFIGVMEQGLWLSNLTANFSILIVVWLWYNQDISTAIWWKGLHRKKYKKQTEEWNKGRKAPFWFQMISLVLMVFLLITYLSLFGYETVW